MRSVLRFHSRPFSRAAALAFSTGTWGKRSCTPAQCSNALAMKIAFMAMACSRFVAGLFLLCGCALPAIGAADTERWTREDFGQVQPPLRQWVDKLGRHVEVCGGDWCQLVTQTSRAPAQGQDVWDAVYLMIYFFGSSDDYRARRRDSATQVLRQYANACPTRSEEIAVARCVLRYLSATRALRYSHVLYDEGARCTGRFSVAPPHFSQALTCKSVPVRALDPADWARAQGQPAKVPAVPR